MIKKHVLAIDVGGTSIMGTLYTYNLEEIETIKRSTEAKKGKEDVLNNVCEVIDKLIDEHTSAIAIAWAGIIDSHAGTVIKSPNIPSFDNVNLTKILAEKYQVPVYVENDTKLFAYAEQQVLHPYSKTFLGIIMGTGLGCGTVLNGSIFRGANGSAGEIGHIMPSLRFTPESEIEKLFTGDGLKKRIKNLTGVAKLEDLDQHFKSKNSNIVDKLSTLIEEMSVWLYGLILTFDPDCIVFGGGVGKNVLPYLLPKIEANLKAKFKETGYPYSAKMEISKVLNSGLVGAGILARKNS